jgi:Bacterial Ig domain
MHKLSNFGTNKEAVVTILLLAPILLLSVNSALGQDNVSQASLDEQISSTPAAASTTPPPTPEIGEEDASEEDEEVTPTPTTTPALTSDLSPPLVENQAVSIFQNQTVTIPLSPGDSRLTYSISTLPLHGNLVGVDNETRLVAGGIAIYTPDPNFIGDDSFKFLAQNRTQDVIQYSAIAQVTIKVNETSKIPITFIEGNDRIKNDIGKISNVRVYVQEYPQYQAIENATELSSIDLDDAFYPDPPDPASTGKWEDEIVMPSNLIGVGEKFHVCIDDAAKRITLACYELEKAETTRQQNVTIDFRNFP